MKKFGAGSPVIAPVPPLMIAQPLAQSPTTYPKLFPTPRKRCSHQDQALHPGAYLPPSYLPPLNPSTPVRKWGRIWWWPLTPFSTGIWCLSLKTRTNTTEYLTQTAGWLFFSVFLTFLFLLVRQLSKPKNLQKVGQLHSIKFQNLCKPERDTAKIKKTDKKKNKFVLSLTMVISL